MTTVRRVLNTVAASGLFGPLALVLFIAAPHALIIATLGALVLVPHVGASWLRAWRGARRTLVVSAALAIVVSAVVLVTASRDSFFALELLWTVASVVFALHVALQAHRVGTALAGSSPRNARVHLVSSALLGAAGVVAVVAGPRAPLALRGALDIETARNSVVALIALVVALGVFAVGGGAASRARAFVIVASPGALWCSAVVVDGGVDPRLLAGGALALGHAAQLLWMSGTAEPRLAAMAGRRFDVFAHVGLAFALGAAVLVDAPLGVSRVFELDPVTVALAVQGAFAIQHAFVDVVAWRLRDRDLCRALTDAALPRATADRGNVSNARALAFAVPAFVLTLGLALDVVLAHLSSSSSSHAAVAVVLEPGDARAHMTLAAGALVAGKSDDARAELGDIARAHAFAPAAERLRLSLCAAGARTLAAERACLALTPPYLHDDGDVLILASSIALHSGNDADAEAFAARAVTVLQHEPDSDESVAVARAALGAAEAARHEGGARAHLEDAIDAHSKSLGSDALVADARFVDAGFALAAVERREKRPTAARAILDRVLQGAEARDTPRVAMRALGEEGRVLDEAGNPREAIGLYQRALNIAQLAEADGADVALLWLDYEALLARSNAPTDARYACVLAAHRAVDKGTDDRAEARLHEADAEIDAIVDDATRARVKADPASAQAAALALDYPDAN